MPSYCINKIPDPNGEHLIHDINSCIELPEYHYRLDLGSEENEISAEQKSKKQV